MPKPAFEDPALPVQAVVVSRCRAALTALAYTNAQQRVITEGGTIADDTQPYCIVGGSTTTGSALFEDKDSRPALTTAQPRVYARSSVEAKRVATEIIRRMTAPDAADPDGFHALKFDLESRIPRVEPTTNDYVIFGEVLTFSIHLQPAPA